MSVEVILLCVCAIVLGATAPKPFGWIVVALAVVALFVNLFGVLRFR